MMDHSVSRILIETIVRKTLRDIRESPERSIRNLVDMALHASKSRFQRHFFEAAQKMLQNEHSPYYALVQNIAANIDHEKLLTFGMNLGYNSCTLGAKKIREIEDQEHFNIPWCVSLHLTASSLAQQLNQCQAVIEEGKELGIYTWLLLTDDQPQDAMNLVFDHPDCAFFFFCQPQHLTRSFVEQASEANNVMLVIHCAGDVTDACGMLQEKGLLYSVYDTYDDSDKDIIISDNWLSKAEALGGIFSALIPHEKCSQETRKTIQAYMENTRSEQLFQTIPVEIIDVCSYVDSIISDDCCAAEFDADGRLLGTDTSLQEAGNLFRHTLHDIFKAAFPKNRKDE